MKKIKNIKQLKYEQERLHEKQKQLEKDIRQSWEKIKKHTRPGMIAKDLVAEWTLRQFAARGIGRLLRLF